MLEEYVNVASQVDEQAPWKISVRQPIRNFNGLNLSYLLPDELTYLKNLCTSLNSGTNFL
jgi:hypothetical protein